MKTKMKKGIIALCALSMMAMLPVAFMSMNNANAETLVATTDGFYMEEGAAVRTTSDELGIRFSATITQTYWQELQATYGEDATYNFYSVVTDGVKPITKNYKNVTPNFTEKSSYTFYSTIVYKTADLESAGLLDEACELTFSAQTYVDVTKAGEAEAVTLAAYGQTDSRSMKAVANAAFLAGETDEELAKYFTVGNRSEKVEGYAFTDKSGGVVTMSAMPAWTDDMEVYYGAEKVNATYENGTVSFGAIPFDAENPYISVFNGSTVYSAKVTEALKITQAQVDDGTLLAKIQTNDANMKIYLAEDISLAGLTWTPTDVFAGMFDGGNHVIDGLTTTVNAGTAYYGFFRRLNGTIKNVAFTNVTLAANSAVICGDTRANTVIENVFIHVKSTAGASSNDCYSAICNRAPSSGDKRTILVTNVVIKMPGTAKNESVYGYQHVNVVQSIWKNVYTIGLKDTTSETSITFPYTSASLGSVPKTTDCGIYKDLVAFYATEKELTPFLQGCANTYMPVVKIYNSNVDVLKSLAGGEYVMLMEDIDLDYATWDNQGSFAGTLDGNGHVIENFTLSGKDNWGFFVLAAGTIKNIGFVGVTLGVEGGKGANVIAARTSGALTLENVFIEVVGIGDPALTNGIVRVANSGKALVTMTNVVVSMPSSNAKIFGTELRYKPVLTNVYTIGMSTTKYADTVVSGCTPTVVGGNRYAGLTAFNGETKTLTPFLTSCVEQYLNA